MPVIWEVKVPFMLKKLVNHIGLLLPMVPNGRKVANEEMAGRAAPLDYTEEKVLNFKIDNQIYYPPAPCVKTQFLLKLSVWSTVVWAKQEHPWSRWCQCWVQKIWTNHWLWLAWHPIWVDFVLLKRYSHSIMKKSNIFSVSIQIGLCIKIIL